MTYDPTAALARFDEKFRIYLARLRVTFSIRNIKSFIETELLLAYKEGDEAGYKRGRADVIEGIAKKIKYLPYERMDDTAPFRMGYAQARKDFVKAIRQYGEGEPSV